MRVVGIFVGLPADRTGAHSLRCGRAASGPALASQTKKDTRKKRDVCISTGRIAETNIRLRDRQAEKKKREGYVEEEREE